MRRALIAILGAAIAAFFVWWASGREPRWYRMYPESFNPWSGHD